MKTRRLREWALTSLRYARRRGSTEHCKKFFLKEAIHWFFKWAQEAKPDKKKLEWFAGKLRVLQSKVKTLPAKKD